MSTQGRTAKFFCENCGAEVPRNAKVCRHCGRFFSSVRCPQCGKTGTPEQFKNGCPECGYTVENSTKKQKLSKEKKASVFSKFALKKAINSFNQTQKTSAKRTQSEDSLPAWIFVLMVGIIIAMIFLFFF